MVYFGKKQSGTGPAAGSATLAGNNTFTGNNTFNNPVVVGTPINNNDATTKQYVDTALANKADTSALANYATLAGNNTFTGTNTFNNAITTTGLTSSNNGDISISPNGTGRIQVQKDIVMNSHYIAGLATPNSAQDAANKEYVDNQIATCAKLASANTFTQTNTFNGQTNFRSRVELKNTTSNNGGFLENFDYQSKNYTALKLFKNNTENLLQIEANNTDSTVNINSGTGTNIIKIDNLVAPTTANQAATKSYVDNLVNQRLPETIPINTEFATGQTLDGKRVYCYYINNSSTNIVDNSTTNITGISGVKHLISYSLSYSNNGQFDERYALPYFDFNSSGALQSKLTLIVGNDGYLKLVSKNVAGNKFLQGLFIYTKD